MRRSSVLLVLAVIASACSGTATDLPSGESDGATTLAGDSARGGPWVEMLSYLPDAAETRGSILLQDFELVRQTLGLELPTSEATEDEVAEYAMTLAMGPVVDGTTLVATRSPMVFLGLHSFNVGVLRDR